MLNSRLDNPEKTASAIGECFRMGIPVLLPDVNRSGVHFTPDRDDKGTPALRFGLAAIKNVGEGAVRPLVEEREKGGAFASMEEFCTRVDLRGLNRRSLESLIKVGAFDSLGNRGALLKGADQVLSMSQREAHRRQTGQSSMFDGAEAGPMAAMNVNGEDVLAQEKVSWERELLGVPLSENPFKSIALVNTAGAVTSRDELDADMDGQRVTLLGQVASISERATRDGRPYAVATLELVYGSTEVIAWPEVLERTREIWQEGRLLLVSGRLKARGDELSVHCEQAKVYTETGDSGSNGSTAMGSAAKGGAGPDGAVPGTKAVARRAGNVVITLVESDDAGEDAHLLREVIRTLLEFPGSDRVHLEISMPGKRVLMELPVVTTGYCPELQERLEALLGAGSVRQKVEMEA